MILVLSMVIGVIAAIVMLRWGERLVIEDTWDLPVDVIIVLGYPAKADGTPSAVMRTRVAKAVELYHRGVAPYLLVTGGGSHRACEATVMADLAQSLGIPAEAIVEEPLARTTQENVRNVAALMATLGWQTAVVVTSPYHTRRTKGLFLKQGLDVAVVNALRPDELGVVVALRDIVYELVAYLTGYG